MKTLKTTSQDVVACSVEPEDVEAVEIVSVGVVEFSCYAFQGVAVAMEAIHIAAIVEIALPVTAKGAEAIAVVALGIVIGLVVSFPISTISIPAVPVETEDVEAFSIPASLIEPSMFVIQRLQVIVVIVVEIFFIVLVEACDVRIDTFAGSGQTGVSVKAVLVLALTIVNRLVRSRAAMRAVVLAVVPPPPTYQAGLRRASAGHVVTCLGLCDP